MRLEYYPQMALLVFAVCTHQDVCRIDGYWILTLCHVSSSKRVENVGNSTSSTKRQEGRECRIDANTPDSSLGYARIFDVILSLLVPGSRKDDFAPITAAQSLALWSITRFFRF